MIEINSVIFSCHFFNYEELEIDFDPIQITSIEHHQIVLDFMLSMSQLLAKPVIMTLENMTTEPLIMVYKNEVTIINPKS